MNDAPRSSRVVTKRIEESESASIRCRFSSPGIPKTYSTPSFSRQSTIKRATSREAEPLTGEPYPRWAMACLRVLQLKALSRSGEEREIGRGDLGEAGSRQ